MIDTDRVVASLRDHGLDAWADVVPEQLALPLGERRHGDLDRWLDTVATLTLSFSAISFIVMAIRNLLPAPQYRESAWSDQSKTRRHIASAAFRKFPQ